MTYKKLNWYEYWIGHCWMTGWQSIRSNFRIWCNLLQGNYELYALLKDDDPFTECRELFWAALNEDDVYEKEFIEYLLKMVDDIEIGEVETYPILKWADDVLDDIDLNEPLNDLDN